MSKPLINTVLPDLGADLLKEPLSLLSNTLNSGHIDNDWYYTELVIPGRRTTKDEIENHPLPGVYAPLSTAMSTFTGRPIRS